MSIATRTRRNEAMIMLCLKCKNERFTEKLVDVLQTFRGEDFTVNAPAMVCTECGWFTMDDAQADKLCLYAADKYRRRHGLLTSAEIIACRGKRGMSQAKFATFLGVGVASIKRWEGGTVQEPVYDELIRRKCGGALSQTYWTQRIAGIGYGVRLKTLQITTVEVTPQRVQAMTRTAGACTPSGPVTFHAQLSDGHPWRAQYFTANDPIFSTTA